MPNINYATLTSIWREIENLNIILTRFHLSSLLSPQKENTFLQTYTPTDTHHRVAHIKRPRRPRKRNFNVNYPTPLSTSLKTISPLTTLVLENDRSRTHNGYPRSPADLAGNLSSPVAAYFARSTPSHRCTTTRQRRWMARVSPLAGAIPCKIGNEPVIKSSNFPSNSDKGRRLAPCFISLAHSCTHSQEGWLQEHRGDASGANGGE